MFVFTYPLAFLGLLAIPALVAIYLLRNRAREATVSSLLLWRDQKQSLEGGRKLEKFQTPLIFFLELLAILFLVTSAAGPMMQAGPQTRPLVVILDDSFSMLAGDQNSPRNRAAQEIERELKSNRYDPVRFILAGESPQLMRESAAGANELQNILKVWKCASTGAKLQESLAFAFELGGNRIRALVLTDHPPEQDIDDSRVQWWAYGESRPNIAIINAARNSIGADDRILLEIANLSSQSNTATLSISPTNAPRPIMIGPGETRRITFTIKLGAEPFYAHLNDDALEVDNRVVLLPGSDQKAKVDLQFRDMNLKRIVESAVKSSENAIIIPDKPDLLMTDDAEPKRGAGVWTLQLISEKDASSFLGPFVIDLAHPLTEGLSLGGVIWGSGRTEQLPGAPVITAGNVPLMTDVARTDGHELRLRLRPDLSTLQDTPNWPILIWNLIEWRTQSAAGVQENNARLGSDVTIKVGDEVESVEVIDPAGNSAGLPVRDNSVSVRAELTGTYRLKAGGREYRFASNALKREESDLSNAASGRWGNWAKSDELQRDYRSLSWLPLSLALAILAVHSWIVRKK